MGRKKSRNSTYKDKGIADFLFKLEHNGQIGTILAYFLSNSNYLKNKRGDSIIR